MAVTDFPPAFTAENNDDFHYASFYLAPRRRARCRALETWRREIAQIPQTCSDRGVAHLKLGWWREELARLAGGEPRHPLAVALAAVADDLPDLLAVVGRYLEQIADGLLEPVLPTRAAVLAEIASVHGELLTADARAGGVLTDAECVTLLDLACASELAYELRGLRQHRRGGPLYLAADRLAAHGLTVDDVRHAPDSRPLAPLLREEMAAVLALLEARLTALPRALGRRHCVFGTQARLVAAAVRLTLADDCRVLERRIELLPAHKLLIAWRSRYIG